MTRFFLQDYPKLSQSYYALLECLAQDHMPFISNLDPPVFFYIMSTISEGLTALGMFPHLSVHLEDKPSLFNKFGFQSHRHHCVHWLLCRPGQHHHLHLQATHSQAEESTQSKPAAGQWSFPAHPGTQSRHPAAGWVGSIPCPILPSIRSLSHFASFICRCSQLCWISSCLKTVAINGPCQGRCLVSFFSMRRLVLRAYFTSFAYGT